MCNILGVVESTGGTTQVRTSYLPSEILWGHRLAPLMTYQKENGQYRIDYSQFHSVEPIAMPECSAKRLAADRQRGVSEEEGEDEHGHAYFTAPAIKLSSAGVNRLSIIRRMRTTLQRRRVRSRPELSSPSSGAKQGADGRPAGGDSVNVEQSLHSGGDVNGQDSATSLTKQAPLGNNSNVNRSISFA
jgi:Inward rectifier potassium channel C-terminal domain